MKKYLMFSSIEETTWASVCVFFGFDADPYMRGRR
jgi:hypothetical protein